MVFFGLVVFLALVDFGLALDVLGLGVLFVPFVLPDVLGLGVLFFLPDVFGLGVLFFLPDVLGLDVEDPLRSLALAVLKELFRHVPFRNVSYRNHAFRSVSGWNS